MEIPRKKKLDIIYPLLDCKMAHAYGRPLNVQIGEAMRERNAVIPIETPSHLQSTHSVHNNLYRNRNRNCVIKKEVYKIRRRTARSYRRADVRLGQLPVDQFHSVSVSSFLCFRFNSNARSITANKFNEFLTTAAAKGMRINLSMLYNA